MERPALINSMLGPHVEVDGVRFMSAVGGDAVSSDRIGIQVAGRTCG